MLITVMRRVLKLAAVNDWLLRINSKEGLPISYLLYNNNDELILLFNENINKIITRGNMKPELGDI